MPIPRHDLFLSDRYRVPFDGGRRFASVLTAYGCPHHCAYCASGAGSLGYAVREVGEVTQELATLARRGDVGHVFFRDMDLTARRERLLELCRWLKRRGRPFSWNCYARPDELDDGICQAMASAGCRLIQLGVETFAADQLAVVGRPMAADQISAAFRHVHRHGMRSGAHVIFGLPGEGWRSWLQTIERVVMLGPDYVSFNLYQRRPGAALVEGGSATDVEPAGLPWGAEWARRFATWRFYFRAGYIAGQIARVRRLEDLSSLMRGGLSLLEYSMRRETSLQQPEECWREPRPKSPGRADVTGPDSGSDAR